jgi:mitochondrial fission protein ELM1
MRDERAAAPVVPPDEDSGMAAAQGLPLHSVRVVIATDGKRGHENQSRVVARMLGDVHPLLMELRPFIRDGGFAEAVLRLRFALFGRESLSRPAAAGLVRSMLKPESADEFREFAAQAGPAGPGHPRIFTVSTGTPPATMNLLLARLLGAQAVVNMTPSLLPRRHFDLNIVPEHDLAGRPAGTAPVLATPLALGYHDVSAAQFQAQQLRREQGLDIAGRYLGLAIGGPSAAVQWDNDLVLEGITLFQAAAEGSGSRLLVTTSRRTPAALLSALRGRLLDRPSTAYFLDASQSPLNPLPAFYEICAGIAVTADSFSMASEALHAGHGPLLLPCSALPHRRRMQRAFDLLRELGLSIAGDTPAAIAAFAAAPPERGEPNAIYEALAEQVRSRLLNK